MVNDKWQSVFENRLKRIQSPIITRVTRYYNSQSDLVLETAVATGRLTEQDLVAVFQTNDFMIIYESLYEEIGLDFANWYARNFDKYQKKGVNPNEFQEPWRAYFQSVGKSVGAHRVTLVQGTAKRNLSRVVAALSADPVYQSSGPKVKARMLQKKFNRYNTYQAQRLVRTESTNAANVGTLKSAEDIFSGQYLRKEWISALDERTREAHLVANGQIVDQDKTFLVRGERLRHPGDPSASAANVINCRCSVAPFPVETSNSTTSFNDFGVTIEAIVIEESLSRV